MATSVRSDWTWEFSFERNESETQFLFVSLDRKRVLLGVERNRYILPGLHAGTDTSSFIKLACSMARKVVPVSPLAILWQETRDQLTSSKYVEVTKTVVLMSCGGEDFSLPDCMFEWLPLRADVSVYHYFNRARAAVNDELQMLVAPKYSRYGLLWNNFDWFYRLVLQLKDFLELDVTSIWDCRFSARGVVLKATTSKGVLFVKCCQTPSFEPAVASIMSTISQCEKPLCVDFTSGILITQDHGASIYPMGEDSLEEECGRLLAEIHVKSVKLVPNLLYAGVLDARPSVFCNRFDEVAGHQSLSWVENELPKKKTIFMEVFRNNQRHIRSWLLKRLNSVVDLPSVLLHNDVASGNIYQSDDGLKIFDFGFSAVGHPYMEMSFTYGMLTPKTKSAYLRHCQHLRLNGRMDVECFDPLIAHSLVVRLHHVLSVLSQARDGEKFVLSSTVLDIIQLLLDHVPPVGASGVNISEVLLKLAKWSTRLVRRGVPDCGASEAMALEFAKSASEMRANFDKPWHWWGSLNWERTYQSMGMSSKEGISHNLKQSVLNSEARQYLTNAIDGFFKSIKIGGKTKLEDSLKVLTLWFKFGSVARMYKAFDRGFEDTVITGWLEVVPQIIARLHTTNRDVQAGIEHLLTRIGNEHPQMVVYNLIVAKNTEGHVARKEAASRVLDSIKRKHPGIVTQAEMVARELVRVAVLWGELWYEKLEEASRLYIKEKDLNSMLQCMLPMHEMIERGPETSYEKSFMDLFGLELLEAGRIIEAIADARQRKASAADLDAEASKLWQCYYSVFGRIQKHQQMMNGLDLSKVSQWLKHASNLELAVPGTYDPNAKETVTLQSFGSMQRILQSKQRPRKLAVLGSDGRQYDFLLKGHEDLRQDERVMQVFGLINQILNHSQERSIRRGVDIKGYAVIALSTNAGLIEWVSDCDTMHALVKEHREVRKVMPNIEHKVMTRVAPEPDRLPLLHKVDIFKFMLQNTSGSDIARVLWLKSRSSEKWLDRRTTYARSLASSSMAGYLLGLGDRHPSNIMMDRASGKILHIDFGDCFEVAMVRDMYPEKVPFRLTRMLVKALEPCGVDGYFRHTCEAAMRELREPNNRESLLSMMEAFVHDPLLRMKLVGGEELQRIREEGNRLAAMNLVLHNAAPPMLSESLQLRLLTQEGSLKAAHAVQMQQEQVHVPVDPPVLGAVATGANPSNQNAVDSAFAKSPATESRRERDRLLKVLPRDKCIEVADERAAIALQRVTDKLYGRDFGDGRERLTVDKQVKLLFDEATSVENLCSLFTGWCPFW